MTKQHEIRHPHSGNKSSRQKRPNFVVIGPYESISDTSSTSTSSGSYEEDEESDATSDESPPAYDSDQFHNALLAAVPPPPPQQVPLWRAVDEYAPHHRQAAQHHNPVKSNSAGHVMHGHPQLDAGFRHARQAPNYTTDSTARDHKRQYELYGPTSAHVGADKTMRQHESAVTNRHHHAPPQDSELQSDATSGRGSITSSSLVPRPDFAAPRRVMEIVAKAKHEESKRREEESLKQRQKHHQGNQGRKDKNKQYDVAGDESRDPVLIEFFRSQQREVLDRERRQTVRVDSWFAEGDRKRRGVADPAKKASTEKGRDSPLRSSNRHRADATQSQPHPRSDMEQRFARIEQALEALANNAAHTTSILQAPSSAMREGPPRYDTVAAAPVTPLRHHHSFIDEMHVMLQQSRGNDNMPQEQPFLNRWREISAEYAVSSEPEQVRSNGNQRMNSAQSQNLTSSVASNNKIVDEVRHQPWAPSARMPDVPIQLLPRKADVAAAPDPARAQLPVWGSNAASVVTTGAADDLYDGYINPYSLL